MQTTALRALAVVSAATLFGTPTWCAGPKLTPEQIEVAIKDGSKYKTAEEVLACVDPEYANSASSQWKHRCERIPVGTRIKLDGAIAKDGTKYATFFNDWQFVAAQAAAANQQMREIKVADVESKGLLHVLIEVHPLGTWGVGKLERRYGNDRAHLVLKIGGRVIQPTAKDTRYREGQSVNMAVIGVPSAKIALNFSFDVSPEDLKQPVEVILIDGDGHKHAHKAELAGVLDIE
jgi:hypothetical protein